MSRRAHLGTAVRPAVQILIHWKSHIETIPYWRYKYCWQCNCRSRKTGYLPVLQSFQDQTCPCQQLNFIIELLSDFPSTFPWVKIWTDDFEHPNDLRSSLALLKVQPIQYRCVAVFRAFLCFRVNLSLIVSGRRVMESIQTVSDMMSKTHTSQNETQNLCVLFDCTHLFGIVLSTWTVTIFGENPPKIYWIVPFDKALSW